MKRALAFLKATLLGGVIVVLPTWLAVLLVLKALGHLEIFVKPVSLHLPRTLEHPRVIAILVLIGLCFLVGVAIRTAIGQPQHKRLVIRSWHRLHKIVPEVNIELTGIWNMYFYTDNPATHYRSGIQSDLEVLAIK
jgi:uncharacterized membrane protein